VQVTPQPSGAALIAYVRMTDKPKELFGVSSFACRFVEGPECPVERIWVIGVDGTGARELVPDGYHPQQLLGWSPDGRHLLYIEDSQFLLADVTGGEPQLLDTGCVEPCWGDETPTLSGDGTALVFVRGTSTTDESTSNIATMDLSTGQVVQLRSTAPKGGSFPNWSPDGNQLVFTRFGRGAEGPFPEINSAVFVVDVDGQNLHQISPVTLDAEYARWSPDGSRILFTSPNREGADVYTMAADGSDVRQLTSDGTALAASWTPDGRVLYARNVNGGESPISFWVMDASGGNNAELISGDATGAVASSDQFLAPMAPQWQATGGPAIVPPPWNPATATIAGPPAPTPEPTPTPEMAAGFSLTGSLQEMESHSGVDTATRLNDGRVLISKICDPVAELYDPAQGTFSVTGSMNATLARGTATLLGDGRVLFAGGAGCGASSDMLDTAQIYDPATGSFSVTGSMGATRADHAAALLADGRVLIAGGISTDATEGHAGIILAATGCSCLASAEVYDPAQGTFSATGSMDNARDDFTATLLLDGRVLVLGGGGEGSAPRRAAELYDPSTGTFSRTGSTDRPRWLHTATRLLDGRVLIAGGRTAGDATMASVEVYDPSAGTFSNVGSLAESRQQHTATLLPDGRVIIAGGYTQQPLGDQPDFYTALASTEIFDPGAGQFVSAGSMGAARWSAVAAGLDDGRVLIVGGTGLGTEDFIQLDSAVLYQP
jgi:Tol biopolymer transport system component